MTFLLISFLAGILTTLAPCVLPLLPVILGGSVADTRSKWKPYTIALSLAVSVVLFTLILKVSTVFISVPPEFWQLISGVIIIILGFSLLFPKLWDKVTLRFNLLVSRKSNTLMYEGEKRQSFWGDVIIGSALGPVFSSCSPTYFVILATVLPRSFSEGFIYLISYSIGLSLTLLLIGILGQKLVGRLLWATNPEGWFKKMLGVLFLLVGIFILTGFDKTVQTYLISNGYYDPTKLEQGLLESIGNNDSKDILDSNDSEVLDENNLPTSTTSSKKTSLKNKINEALYPSYKEIVNPSGFVNSSPITIGKFIGKKVILIDIMTYSCINCQRTFPYLKAWYEKYESKGLEIIAIHTPEFAFEKNIKNVEEAMKKFGIKFPVVLDNNYATWNAYKNIYWPHKYLIDIQGKIRYDHAGEGKYEEIEEKIKELLLERSDFLGLSSDMDNTNAASSIAPVIAKTASPETYFGAARNEYFGNGTPKKIGIQEFFFPGKFEQNKFYLSGKWNIQDEWAEPITNGKLHFEYISTKVYLVAEGKGDVKVSKNGVFEKTVNINGAELYTLIDGKDFEEGKLDLEIPEGVRIYTFTFG